MRAPITDKHLLEMMWERFPEIMQRGTERTWDINALYAAWYAVGADVAGLGWDSFVNKLKENT